MKIPHRLKRLLLTSITILVFLLVAWLAGRYAP